MADEAPKDRDDLVQMVIDVLCAYLRVPYTPAPGPLPDHATAEQAQSHDERDLDFAALREVRHTIIRIIGNRLREEPRWRGKNYDFTGTVFDGGDFSRAHFTGGTVSFLGAHFTDGADTGGKVSFSDALFTGAEVSFSNAHFTVGSMPFLRGLVNFSSASGTCPSGLLQAAKEGDFSAVVLPKQWQPTADEGDGQERGQPPANEEPGH
ncbi:pentapeptide repeat-containing protein [Nocardiopsis sp. HNM0947]|uniref:Pentapeptide repeat-containing protein n=1 Tax=Nocardiopsis coralli TaxID=2772213 RepID=A0ABR9P039_9ACTN|nr:pentapeptide repeat-containing protein [Nocardiopsis coralli]MBE2997192.1 pentapeptide repeat-containing protein [Nocardiopsis coralli]